MLKIVCPAQRCVMNKFDIFRWMFSPPRFLCTLCTISVKQYFHYGFSPKAEGKKRRWRRRLFVVFDSCISNGSGPAQTNQHNNAFCSPSVLIFFSILAAPKNYLYFDGDEKWFYEPEILQRNNQIVLADVYFVVPMYDVYVHWCRIHDEA